MSSRGDGKGGSGKKRKAESASTSRPNKRSRDEARTIAELLQQLADRDQQVEEQARQLQQQDEELQDERSARLAERSARLAERRARLDGDQLRGGTFYATFDEVWEVHGEPFRVSHYNSMIRNECPSYKSTIDKRWDSEFKVTMEKASQSIYDAAIRKPSMASSIASSRASSRSSREPAWNRKTWPMDVLQSRFPHPHRSNRDLFIQVRGASQESQQSDAAQLFSNAPIAHLVPAADNVAALYHHVAIWVFGVKPGKCDDPIFVQKLIHGSVLRDCQSEQPSSDAKPPAKRPLPHETTTNVQSPKNAQKPQSAAVENPRPAKRTSAKRASMPPPSQESEQDSSSGNRSRRRSTRLARTSEASKKQSSEASKKPRRVSGTGLKHMVCNKIRLSGQETFFDKSPCLIIVPILTLKQAKDWNGEGYDALFMISTGVNTTTIEGQPPPPVDRISQALPTVSANVGLGLNFGAVANKTEIDCARNLLTTTLKGLAFSLVEKSADSEEWVSALSITSKPELDKLRTLPLPVSGEKKVIVPKKRKNDKKVRKITFAPAFGIVKENGHPAPDPLLLVTKAAVNWSWFHNQKLMVAGEIVESDCEMSERSIGAMEEDLTDWEHDEQAFRHEEIMKMGEIRLENPPCTGKSAMVDFMNGPTRTKSSIVDVSNDPIVRWLTTKRNRAMNQSELEKSNMHAARLLASTTKFASPMFP